MEVRKENKEYQNIFQQEHSKYEAQVDNESRSKRFITEILNTFMGAFNAKKNKEECRKDGPVNKIALQTFQCSILKKEQFKK